MKYLFLVLVLCSCAVADLPVYGVAGSYFYQLPPDIEGYVESRICTGAWSVHMAPDGGFAETDYAVRASMLVGGSPDYEFWDGEQWLGLNYYYEDGPGGSFYEQCIQFAYRNTPYEFRSLFSAYDGGPWGGWNSLLTIKGVNNVAGLSLSPVCDVGGAVSSLMIVLGGCVSFVCGGLVCFFVAKRGLSYAKKIM